MATATYPPRGWLTGSRGLLAGVGIVMPQATGLQIQSILKKDGDRVQSGEIIAVLDSSVLQDQLNEARSHDSLGTNRNSLPSPK